MPKNANRAKAKRLVKTLIKNNLSQADTAREIGVTQQAVYDQIKNNPLVRSALENYLTVLEKAGATDKKSARVISEAMDAERTVSVMDETEDAKPGSRANVTEPDHAIRLKANEQYLKIKKLIGQSDDAAGTKDNPVQIVIMNYGENPNSGASVSGSGIRPGSAAESIEIQVDPMAPARTKDHPKRK